MSVYHLDDQESPWAILDPSLKQPTCFWNSSEENNTKPTYLDFPMSSLIHQTQAEFIQEEEDEEKRFNIQDYLDEIKEIEKELLDHRNSIYSEKLKALEEELLSIEQETHKTIIKQDKKFARKRDRELQAKEAMYLYELEAIDKQVEYERANIYQDVKRNEEFARRVVTSEGTIYNNNGTSGKKRKEKSPSSTHSDTEDSLSADEEHQPPAFKRIYLSKKMSKLQAISDRQRTAKSSKRYIEDALDSMDNQLELERDLMLMKQAVLDDH